MTDTAKGKTVFVAGGAKGIGLGVVRALAADGFDVTFSYRGSATEAAEVKKQLQEAYPSQTIEAVQVDLSEKDQVEQFAKQIAETESLYGLVYNAGGSYDTLAVLADQDKAEALFQLNFWAMTRLAAAAARPLMRSKDGRIVTIGSVTSQLALGECHAAPAPDVDMVQCDRANPYLDLVVARWRRGVDLRDPEVAFAVVS